MKHPTRLVTLVPAPRVAPSRPTPPGRKRSKGNRALAGARGVIYVSGPVSLSREFRLLSGFTMRRKSRVNAFRPRRVQALASSCGSKQHKLASRPTRSPGDGRSLHWVRSPERKRVMMPPRPHSAETTPEFRADRRLAWLLLWVVAVGVLLAPLVVPIIELVTRDSAPEALQWVPPGVALAIVAIIVPRRTSLRAHLAKSSDLIRSASPGEWRAYWLALAVSFVALVGLFLTGQAVPEPWHDLVQGLASDATLVFGFFAGMLIVRMPPPRATSSSQPPPP